MGIQAFYVVGGIIFSRERVICAEVSENQEQAHLWLEGRTEPLIFLGMPRVRQLQAVLDPSEFEKMEKPRRRRDRPPRQATVARLSTGAGVG